MSFRRFSALALLLGAGGSLGSCVAPAADSSDMSLVGQSTQAVEWVGYHTEVPLRPQDFHSMASGLIGDDAQAGRFTPEFELATGIFVKAEAEPSTPTQSRLTFALQVPSKPRRTLAMAPASFALGSVYIATVDAALAKMQADNAKLPGDAEAFFLEYRVASAQGGKLSLGVRGDRGKYSLVLDIATPRTSLVTENIGQAADKTAPHDSVAGTVWFHMNKDDFDFFTDRAYGKGATSRQNFTDFALVPHEWLHLTVEPHLDQKFVNVGFEVITLADKRIAFAKAPASILAGDVYSNLVSTSMGNMLAQEKAAPGSSTPFSIPFYYDNPKGGGVVQVIANGDKGIFSVAYSVESPTHPLMDVPFVAYQPVTIPPPDPKETASCDQLGDPNITPAPKGTFDIKFIASKVVLNSPDLKGPLKGTLYCSVFHAKDVTVSGPKDGVQSVQDFQVADADLMAATAPKFTTQELWGGDYQILCYQDLFAGGTVKTGDPVTLPIGSYQIGCNINPVTVEFAILDPQ